MTRRYLPYFAVSLAVHIGLFVLFLLWKIPPRPEPIARRVTLEFIRPARTGLPREQPAAAGKTDFAPASLRGLAMPDAGKLELPQQQPRRTVARPVFRFPDKPASFTSGEKPALSEPAAALAFPSSEEVLRRVLAGSEPRPAESRSEQEPAGHGYVPPSALEWEVRQRTLLKGPELKFPDILLEKGLEAEVEALFTVAPAGQVTGVEITRSSGFATVDRAVEQALFNALFTPSAEDEEDQGRVQFRFRLERKQ